MSPISPHKNNVTFSFDICSKFVWVGAGHLLSTRGNLYLHYLIRHSQCSMGHLHHCTTLDTQYTNKHGPLPFTVTRSKEFLHVLNTFNFIHYFKSFTLKFLYRKMIMVRYGAYTNI